MKKENKQILINIVAILMLLGFVAYGHYAITKIANSYVENRKDEAKFLVGMVRDNWDGIKTIPPGKKKILLENLSPKYAGTDIQVMTKISLFMVYLFGAGFIFDRIVVIGRIKRRKR